MRGRYKIQSAEGWKWHVFFPNKRVRFARADKAVGNFAVIVLVAHVDLFEQSSSPPERNIKWPKTGES